MDSVVAPETLQPRRTILVVEDEVLIRMVICESLRDEGYTVVEAIDGREALKLLQTQSDIGLLITDVWMPGEMDGLALASSARERWGGLNVLIVSGHAPAAEALAVADAFLHKPFRIDTLIAAVGKLNERLPK